jgi:hypothetical protein
MGSSESKSPSPSTTSIMSSSSSLTPLSQIEPVSTRLRQKQVVAMMGRDVQNEKEGTFNFWVCTVDDKEMRDYERGTRDSFMNCSGTSTDRGDILFWLLKDYNTKYQIRPATETEVENYVKSGQETYGVHFSKKAVPWKLFRDQPLVSSSEKELVGEKNKNSVNDSLQGYSLKEGLENVVIKQPSGLHPFQDKEEERRYGVYGMRIIREYANKAKIRLAAALSEVGEKVQ